MPSSPSSTLFALSAASAAAALSPPSLTAHAFIGTLPCSQLIHQSNLDPIVSAIARLADSPGKSATSHANTPDVRLQGVECCVALHSCSQQGAESVIMCLAHNGAICDRLKEALAMALALEVPCCLSPPWPCRVRFAATMRGRLRSRPHASPQRTTALRPQAYYTPTSDHETRLVHRRVRRRRPRRCALPRGHDGGVRA